MKTLLFLLGTGILLASCATHNTKLEELKSTSSNYQISYDATRRGSVVSISGTGEINTVLSEVQPDAAIATTREITTKLMAKLKSGDSVSADQITKITETLSKLGERTAPVNMLRDALYRLEEHCVNFKDHCQDGRYWDSFQTVIKAITDVQKEISSTAASEAKAEEEKTLRALTPDERKKYRLDKEK